MNKLFCLFFFFFSYFIGSFFAIYAQQKPVEIKYGSLNIRALRYHPDASDASDIMRKVMENKQKNDYLQEPFIRYDLYQKTSVDVLAEKQSVADQLSSSQIKNDFVYKYFVRPFEPWLNHARSPEKYPNYLSLTTLLYEDYKTIFENNRNEHESSEFHASRTLGFFETIGQQNVSYLLDEVFGNINLYQNTNEVMLLQFKSPLGEDALATYSYRLIGMKQVDNQPCYEVAFFCENMKENAFAGYFYISTDGNYALVKSQFTLNNPTNMNFLQNILITHIFEKKGNRQVPIKKEYSVMLGDEVKGCVVVERTLMFNNYSFSSLPDNTSLKNRFDENYKKRAETYWDSIRPMPLTPAQEQIGELVKTADLSRSFSTMQDAILIFLNNRVTIGGIKGRVEVGPITQFVSYNNMEGLRLKVGGNTTINFLNQWLLGGYVAYGTSDEMLKYRADIIYSLQPRDQYIWEYPKNLISFTYVKDMNIPGQNLLTTNRDNFIYSFSHASTNNMSLQKIGLLTFENELIRHFSYKIGGQYKYDKPEGIVQYLQVQGGDTSVVPDISTSELQVSLRFSPGEKFIQAREKRIYVRRGDLDLNLDHRIGLKNIFGSNYSYQITELKGYKKVTLGTVGNLDLHLSAGKVWNRVPFPLLFIPEGNQSYIFEAEGYNCMNFYEFATDNYVAGNMNLMFNWSPFRWFNKKDKTKISLGTRIMYGPLSDNNNPELHPELFIFNQGVNPLGKTPYAEVTIGLANIFKVLRIEYARRLTYLDSDEESGGHKVLKGSLLLTGSFSF